MSNVQLEDCGVRDCFILNFTRPKTHAQARVVTPGKFQKYLEETEKEEGVCWDVQQ